MTNQEATFFVVKAWIKFFLFQPDHHLLVIHRRSVVEDQAHYEKKFPRSIYERCIVTFPSNYISTEVWRGQKAMHLLLSAGAGPSIV